MRRLSRENRRALLSAVGKRRAQRIAPVALSADSTPRSIAPETRWSSSEGVQEDALGIRSGCA